MSTCCCFDCRLFIPEGRSQNDLADDQWDECLEGECRAGLPVLGQLLTDLHGDSFRLVWSPRARENTAAARHGRPRWPTLACLRDVATTLPRWQSRDTWPHGGPRAVCHYGRRMYTHVPLNRYFPEI
jgi:hypothetical protein